MKVKTSVTLSSALLEAIDKSGDNRSAFLERAAHQYLAQMVRAGRDLRDAAILEERAAQLNLEAEDVLDYQGFPE